MLIINECNGYMKPELFTNHKTSIIEKIIAQLFFTMSIMPQLYAQWTLAGTQGFSDGSVTYNTSAAFYNNNVYVAFQDAAHGNAASVMKYNGINWSYIGNAGFSNNDIGIISLAISNTGIPYVVYSDAVSGQATVKKYAGASWQLVGSAQFTPGSAYNPSIAIDNAGTPYVAFSDYNSNLKLSVMKYDGSGWVYVGPAGFSTGIAGTPSIKISAGGAVFVAYQNGAANAPASLVSFNGSSWAWVGGASLPGSAGTSPQLMLSSNGTPYVGLADNVYSIPKLWTFQNNIWTEIGAGGFSGISGAFYPKFSLAVNDTPYIAFLNNNLSDHNVSVVKYNGTNWGYVGSQTVSDGYFGTGNDGITSLSVINDNMGRPYVIYSDYSGSYNGKITAKVSVPANNTSAPYIHKRSLGIYPNPANDQLTVSCENCYGATAEIHDLSGRLWYNYPLRPDHVIDIHKLPQGVYMLIIRHAGEKEIVKFAKS